jgi:hypothetical protein
VSRSDDNTDVLRRAASGADQGNARPMTMGIAKVGRVTANALVYRARMGAEGQKKRRPDRRTPNKRHLASV